MINVEEDENGRLSDFQRSMYAEGIHFDSQLWSRTIVLIGMQSLVLAGAYFVRNSRALALPLLIMGVILTVSIARVARSDEESRNEALAEAGGPNPAPFGETDNGQIHSIFSFCFLLADAWLFWWVCVR